MPLQASDSEDDLDHARSQVSSDIMGPGDHDELLEEHSGEDSDAMNDIDASPPKPKGNSNTRANGNASFASTTRTERQTNGVNGEKRNATIVSLADVMDDGQESDDESSAGDSELPPISKFKPKIQPGGRRGRSTRTPVLGTNDNDDRVKPTQVPKKRGRTPKKLEADPKDEDIGLSEQPSAKRRGRVAAVSSSTKTSPASRLTSRGRGQQSGSRKLIPANETGQRRSARAAAAAAEAQAKAAAEDKANKSQATASATKPARARGRRPVNKRNEYVVEAILDHCLNKKGEPEYLVKWEGYPASQRTWEPKSNLTKCKTALNNYLKSSSKA